MSGPAPDLGGETERFLARSKVKDSTSFNKIQKFIGNFRQVLERAEIRIEVLLTCFSSVDAYNTNGGKIFYDLFRTKKQKLKELELKKPLQFNEINNKHISDEEKERQRLEFQKEIDNHKAVLELFRGIQAIIEKEERENN